MSVPLSKPVKPLSVSELTLSIKEMLGEAFANVWVSGEISEISRPHSGHVYLTLKDETAQLKGVIWRGAATKLPFEPREGQQVVCCGTIDVFPPRGSYQLVVRHMEPLGIGALQLAFQQLKEKLAKEGLFSPERKKPVPTFPRRIAFVTSPTGAAVRDFLQVASRRWRGIQLTIVPAKVQGEGAAADIARAIAAAHKIVPRPHVLVVGRGGGSVEDLWCFNEEIVVRAVAASTIPTVSAVGHEIDVTLCDLAADLRALTPSEAAERLVPAADEVKAMLAAYQERLTQRLRHSVRRLRDQVEQFAARGVLLKPFDRIQQQQQLLDEYFGRLKRAARQRRQTADQQLRRVAGQLEALSPLGVLQRGYSVTLRSENEQVLRSSEDVAIGEQIVSQLARGRLVSRVEEIESE